jgi:hypothetical protein
MKRTLLGSALALCVCAIVAEPAFGTKVFKATTVGKEFSEAEPGKSRTRGLEGELQEFKFGPFHIQCEKATGKGEVTAKQSKTLFTAVTFGRCTTLARLEAGEKPLIHLATHFVHPVDFEYHANGFAESGSESESEMRLVNPGTVILKVNSIKCTINWPAQTIPVKAISKPEAEYSFVTYTNEEVSTEGKNLRHFPSGFEKEIVITNALKKMEFSFEGGQCEEFAKKEGKSGTYKGSLKALILNGNLSVGEEEVVV